MHVLAHVTPSARPHRPPARPHAMTVLAQPRGRLCCRSQGWSIHEKTDGLAGVDGPTSTAACPHEANGTWTAWNGSAFSSDYDVQVECLNLTACACERFLVSGAEELQPDKMGYYTRNGSDFNARSVYTKRAVPTSLFLGSDNWWQVAQELEADGAHTNVLMISLPHGAARGSSTCPEPNATWLVRNGTAWSEGLAVQIACSPPASFNGTSALKGAKNEWLEDPTAAEATYGHITYWDVSNVTNMDQMFQVSANYYSNWTPPATQDQSRLPLPTMPRLARQSAGAFNQPLFWDVSSVTSMYGMFQVRSASAPLA